MQHNAQKERKSGQLDRIALDQIYVGHFPLDTKYLCLFRNGQRRTDPLKVLVQRARIRHRILFEQLASAEHKDWISEEQYSRVEDITKNLSAWTVEEERAYFGQEEDILLKNAAPKDDSRFTVAPRHEVVLAAAEQIEKQLTDDYLQDSPNEDEDSSDSDSELDPLQLNDKRSEKRGGGKTISPPLDQSVFKEKESANESTSDDSSSSSSSDESSFSDQNKPNQNVPSNTKDDPAPVADDDSGDDFFVDVDDSKTSIENPFSNSRQKVEAFVAFKGDKSKGWTTQKQRLGQWQGQKSMRGALRRGAATINRKLIFLSSFKHISLLRTL